MTTEPPPAVSIDDAGLMLMDAVRVMGTLEAAGVHLAPPYQPLARGLLTAGEAARLVPAVVMLALALYPRLSDADVLAEILRTADLTAATGAPN